MNEDFKKASEQVWKLKNTPTNEDLLMLYGLYKQATEGDVQGKRPGFLDFKGRAKYDAWSQHEGKSKTMAERDYVAYVQELMKSQGIA